MILIWDRRSPKQLNITFEKKKKVGVYGCVIRSSDRKFRNCWDIAHKRHIQLILRRAIYGNVGCFSLDCMPLNAF